ncbi:MAG: bacteriophage CI repressor [Methylacidiphilales bacterium]|nr:bacteriophage CI repressor [Candidatus Methylacidiphilales bacterium]
MADLNVRAILAQVKSSIGASTDSELSKKIGVPYQTINSWKKRNSIPLEALIDITTRFNLSIDAILAGSSPPKDASIEREIYGRCLRLSIELALTSSGLSDDQTTVVRRNMGYFFKIMRMQVKHMMRDGAMTSDEAFAIQEKIVEKAKDEKGILFLPDGLSDTPPDEGDEPGKGVRP